MRVSALLLLVLLSGPPAADIVVAFERLPAEPQAVPYLSDLDVDAGDGHLQGIQRFGDRYLLSGSSETESYLVILTPSENGAEYVRLSERPLSHAGGFQMNDGLLAIGIEDPESRRRSVVEIYDVSRSLGLRDGPVSTIAREGEAERMTAGAVGIARLADRVLVVVGNWDSRDLDFYESRPGETEYEMVATITGRASPGWLAYQNLNLFAEDDAVYLLGTATDGDRNIADLYQLQLSAGGVVALHKVSSRRFDLPERVQFKWGAGAWRAADGGLELGVSEEKLRRGGRIMLFRTRP